MAELTSTTLVFYVNGVRVVEENPQPEWTLLSYLRNKLRLKGTKLGCGEGGCGACTTMVSRYDRQTRKITHHAVNSCLAPLCSLHGMAVTTVEGLGNDEGYGKRRLHSVQERIGRSHGSQCGFCTPGFVMSMYTLLRNDAVPSMGQVTEAFQGNLCRCTGYRPILEGCRTFTKEFQSCCGGNNKSGGCCMLQDLDTTPKHPVVATSLIPEDFVLYDPSQEPIFPPELQLSSELDESFLRFQGEKSTWFRPVTMEQLLELKSTYPDAKIVAGNTELGLESKYQNKQFPVLIHPASIPELRTFIIEKDGIIFGGSVVLDAMEKILQDQIKILPESETRIFAAIVQMLQWFGGKQIRNVASIAGNIFTASPISDLIPIFMAANCILELRSKQETRYVSLDQNFFTGYRQTIIRNDEILCSIKIPKTRENEYFFAYKQSRRRVDDISIVNAAFRLCLDPESQRIEDLNLVFGGMGPTAITATKTKAALLNSHWNEQIIDKTCEILVGELPLDPSSPGGMPRYRQALCLSLFFKFCTEVNLKLNGSEYEKPSRNQIESSQLFEIVAEEREPIGVPIPHSSALKHATGEAAYCDDIPQISGELYMGFVLSRKAHARILSIDPAEAFLQKGVHYFLSAKDIPQFKNVRGKVIKDEEIFASDKVTCYGQIIGCVLADSKEIAQRAAKLVHVEYEDIQPLILTIEDAIHHNSFYEGHSKSMICGDVNQGFEEAEHVLEGTFQIAGQEHFYLETNAVLVIPKEDGEMEIFASAQDLTAIQLEAADLLNVAANRIVCRSKRVGGAFGGKQTRTSLVVLPAVIAAAKLKRPVRCMLDRDEDMILTGMRNPVRAQYKAGFNGDGKILALQMEMFFNGGNSLDVSGSVICRSLLHLENAYKIPNVCVNAHVCRTNLPSNTAFRGFGAPQSMLTCENLVHEIAGILGKDPSIVRSLNLYQEGDTTPFNQVIERCTVRRCWDECLQNSAYWQRRQEIQDFNKRNPYKKRGIAIVPTKYGIGFSVSLMNQAGALVHVYTDGSVLLTHGGIEMGQGLHVKMIQVASKILGIPHTRIYTSETATDKVANTSPTAASFSSDLYGMAVMKACEAIMERLEPVKKSLPSASWDEWIKEAYKRQISLSASGFYSLPELSYDFETKQGRPYNYFTFGAACSEVEIDCLTGDHRVLRTDIVMDVGESLNPAIDIGQIEGAFVQGMGMFTLEEPLFSAEGVLRTRGPSTYKIPTCDDIPQGFNVSLLRGSPNPRAVFSSKAVGEPPLFLSSSVFFAIRDAVAAARQERGLAPNITIDSPCTAERIRLGCEDNFTKHVLESIPGTYQPWTVGI